MTLKSRLIDALDNARGERGIHAFLKQEPWLVWATFMNGGGHSNYVIPEFSLSGMRYPDFAIMQSFSGGWKVAFVELEPVDEKPFKKKKIKQKYKTKEVIKPSDRLLGAIEQIKDWRDFEQESGAALRQQLAIDARSRDTLYPEHNLAREPWSVKMPLRDPRTYLQCSYFIVIGRRNYLDEELMHEKAKFFRHYDTEMVTYDRLIEVAETLEQQYNFYKSRLVDNEEKAFLSDFSQNPKKYDSTDINHLQELDVYGTSYKLEPIKNHEGVFVEVLGTVYEIYEDRKTFTLCRVDPDGAAWIVANVLESLSTAIQLAEIHERFLCFHVNTGHPLTLIDDCLQYLIENLSDGTSAS